MQGDANTHTQST